MMNESYQKEPTTWAYWMHSVASCRCEFKIFIRGEMDRGGIERMIQHLGLIVDIYDRKLADGVR
jgi:hypothetical protein